MTKAEQCFAKDSQGEAILSDLLVLPASPSLFVQFGASVKLQITLLVSASHECWRLHKPHLSAPGNKRCVIGYSV